MKPIIGVIPLYDEKKDSLWMLPGYFNGVIEAGGIPVMFPLVTDADMLHQIVDECDGILFTGGFDVTPSLYYEDVLEPELCSYCPELDQMEEEVLKYAMEKDMAIFGICRGLQFINAYLGGTLYQDIPMQHPSELIHRQEPPYDLPVHDVYVFENTPLHTITGVDTIAVNSCHHQAIKELAPGLTAMATSPDGLIEAVYQQEKHFLFAVQWHPEFMHKRDEISRKLFKAFIEAAKK